AVIDRQNLIGGAVRDEQPRAPLRRRAHDESGRAGDHTWEQVAVGKAEGERVRRAVGEAADRQARRVDRQPVEYVFEGTVQKSNVFAEAVRDRVPGSAA